MIKVRKLHFKLSGLAKRINYNYYIVNVSTEIYGLTGCSNTFSMF